MTTQSPTLGSRLRAAREAKGWTVERLVAEASVERRHIVRLEDSPYEARATEIP